MTSSTMPASASARPPRISSQRHSPSSRHETVRQRQLPADAGAQPRTSRRAAPARRRRSARTADRTKSACGGRARSPARRCASIASSSGAAWVVSSSRPAWIDSANHALRRPSPMMRQPLSSVSAHSGCARMCGPNSTDGNAKAVMVMVSSTASDRVLRTDDGAAEPEDRPERDDEADLRQQIDAEHVVAGGAEGDVGQPERQRRALHAAEQIFAAVGEVEGDVARRAGIEQRRQDEPQRGLRQHDQPEHQHRPRADQFDDQGRETHAKAGRRMRRCLSLKRHRRSGNTRCRAGRRSGRQRPVRPAAAPPPARTAGGDARSDRAGAGPRDARARRSPCGSRSRSPDDRARGGTSAGRATPWRRSRRRRSRPRCASPPITASQPQADVELVAAVDEHMLRPVRQRMHGLRQRPERGAQDVVALDPRDRGDGHGHLRGRADLLEQLLARARASASWNRRDLLGMRFGSRMTAAATTGPASGPRPASSQPATRRMPFFRIARSRRNDGRGAGARASRLPLSSPWPASRFPRCLRSNHRRDVGETSPPPQRRSGAYRRNPRSQNRLSEQPLRTGSAGRRCPSALQNVPSSA